MVALHKRNSTVFHKQAAPSSTRLVPIATHYTIKLGARILILLDVESLITEIPWAVYSTRLTIFITLYPNRYQHVHALQMHSTSLPIGILFEDGWACDLYEDVR
jgi:hypothetical protein